MRRLALCSLAVLISAGLSFADTRTEYRAFWVDTFNTALNNHSDVLAVVNNATAANANAIFVQVRRRGDSWYLNSKEPIAEMPFPPGFDPLQDLITEAHAANLEVHAFVIIGAIWNRHPTILAPPVDANHVFNTHGFDQKKKQFYEGGDNWLTRARSGDFGGTTLEGYRVGSDFWIDLGHPDAAQHTHDVLMHLVTNYAVDGLHLDRIRYPELSVTGQTPATGTSTGYNVTSVRRFNQYYGITPLITQPARNDPRWSQWRRDQVTNFVRRIYLSAIAVRPEIKISAALIVFGGAPSTWTLSEAYWRVYQDWDGWLREGIIDLAVPMNYKREHIASQAAQFDTWTEWTRNHQYNRASLIGLGAFVNAIEGTLRQTRRSLAESSAGNKAAGVVFFSMATSNEQTNNGATPPAPLPNPWAIPPTTGPTPRRSYAEFVSGLTRGTSTSGTTRYEPQPSGWAPIFQHDASLPEFSWKTNPASGHLMGFALREDGTALDTAAVTLMEYREGASPEEWKVIGTSATDGNGFFGGRDALTGIDLLPSDYIAKVTLGTTTMYTCPATVTLGRVTRADAHVDLAPVISEIDTDPARLWPPNHDMIDVTLDYQVSDECTTRVEVVVTSNEPEEGLGDGDTAPDYQVVSNTHVRLRAERAGTGTGRVYTITVTATDVLGQTTSRSVVLTVPLNQGNRP